MKLSNIERSIAAGTFGLLLLAGCTKAKPAADQDDAAQTSESGVASESSGEGGSDVYVSDDVRKACGLPDGPTAPRFEFDESNLQPRGENILDKIAVCITEGPLKGSNIRIVGRTDPRGTQEHNEELGTTRAESVRDYLAEQNVPAANMSVVSRGEQGATGDDEASWQLDRRVDLELAAADTDSSANVE